MNLCMAFFVKMTFCEDIRLYPLYTLKGISLRKGDRVIGMSVIRSLKSKLQDKKTKEEKNYLLIVTENGFGKRADLKEYRLQGRGGSGIITAKVTPKTGDLLASRILTDEEDLIVISEKGQVIRTEIKNIPVLSRATQGVRIMRLEDKDKIASVACI